MPTDFKTILPTCYASPWDVRSLHDSIKEKDRSSNFLIDDATLNMYLVRASGIIRGALDLFYPTTGIEITPWSMFPQIPKVDEDGTTKNTGTGELMGVQAASTCETEMWTVTFSSSTAFDVKGTRSGSQGSGTTSVEFTSTNSDITIPTDAWSGTPAANDDFFVPIYNHHQMIVAICTFLATSMAIKAWFNANYPNESGTIADDYYNQGKEWLDALVKGEIELSTYSSPDVSDMQSGPYEISIYGYDVSNYKLDDFDRYVGSSSDYANQYRPWWVF